MKKAISTKTMHIAFMVPPSKAGDILLMLVESGVSNLEFHAVEQLPHYKNKPKVQPKEPKVVKRKAPTKRKKVNTPRITARPYVLSVLKNGPKSKVELRALLAKKGMASKNVDNAIYNLHRGGLVTLEDGIVRLESN